MSRKKLIIAMSAAVAAGLVVLPQKALSGSEQVTQSTHQSVVDQSDPSAFVDLFLGCEATKLPKPEGIATKWSWPKAQVGNTHPGACYPYGMVSACAYSGGYPTGYGLNRVSTSGQPVRLFEEYTATGFTHFQQTGTGTVGAYYNYFKVIPLAGGLDQVGRRWKLTKEGAHPGYYSAELDNGVRAELTVGRKCAFHRYIFQGTGDFGAAVDLSAGGLEVWDHEIRPVHVECELLSERSAEGHIVADGMPIYFYVEADPGSSGAELFSGAKALGEQKSMVVDCDEKAETTALGVLFRGRPGADRQIVLRFGFSLRSVEQARANLTNTGADTFDELVRETRRVWNNYLGRIRVEGGTDEQVQQFYTALYHSLIKPADFCGENPKGADRPLFLDNATMWDQYKTSLPLMVTFYPERAKDLVNSFLSIAEDYGAFPSGTLMKEGLDFDKFDDQAAGLPQVIIADAYVKGLSGVDWVRAKNLMARVFRTGEGLEFVRTGKHKHPTQVLDLAYAAFCTAELAKGLGDRALCREMMGLSMYWRKVLDPSTGRLVPGRYYEGGSWNYSFRLLHDMAGRIGLYGGDGGYCRDLDAFFGIADPPADSDYHAWEGLNNEPDMEVPYTYIYAGRPDRTAEVVRACLKYQFSTGRGGLPGNDDSGGTSSWYVWSSIGVFPVAGQDIFLIGSPVFEKVTMELGSRPFVISAENGSDENIYVQSATLNGKPLERAYLRFAEMKSGGELVLRMGPRPSGWGRDDPPPSYSEDRG